MKIRKLHTKDWSFLPSWKGVPNQESLPQNGVGGFIVESQPDRTPVAVQWLALENDVANLSEVYSNEFYKDTDREDAIQLLLRFTKDFVATIDYKLNTK